MGVRLQKIIGVDKKNPHFTICQDTSIPGNLYVFFGAALMEVVPADQSNPEFKLLIARLYNSGLRVKLLKEEFKIARTTMQRWGDALKSGDTERLVRALAGPGAPQKLTPEIRAFVKVRFPKIYQEIHYNYSALIREEIKDVFGKDISAESLRPIFNELKKKDAKCDEKEANRCDFTDEGLPASNAQIDDGQKQLEANNEEGCSKQFSPQVDKSQICNRKDSLAFYSEENAKNLGPIFDELKKKDAKCDEKEANSCDLRDDEHLPDSNAQIVGQKQLEANNEEGCSKQFSPQVDKSQVCNHKDSLAFYSEENAKNLGPIFNELKKKDAKCDEKGANRCDLTDEVLADSNAQIDDGQKQLEANHEEGCSKQFSPQVDKSQVCNHKDSLAFYSRVTAFCHHLGVLIFSNEIYKFSQYIKNALSRQFLVTVLLGAKNIEQTKILDFSALRAMLGIAESNLFRQRKQLSQIATDDNAKELAKFNAQIVNAHQSKDFYFDPHIKRYSGIQNILKGWCSIIKQTTQILNMDFIHIAPDGHPVYVEPSDNFHNMPERFMKEISDFRNILDYEDQILTFIVDRGIYSFEVFETIIDNEYTHIITWEKGYKKDKWDDNKINGEFSVYRARNNSHDLFKYDFKYIDQKWEKRDKMRQLIVRATNPKGRCIEVSILTDDTGRKAEEIIELMFARWIQENDFKYEAKHFGINEITSYSASSYKELESSIKDKQTKRGEYKALEKEAQNIKRKLKEALFKKHTLKNKKKKQEMEEKIKQLSSELEGIKERMSKTARERSKVEELIEKEYKRLDTNNKKYMDYIKIIARNIFYKALKPFKEKYDNYRDDHVIFRNMSQAHGLVSFADDKVKVIIFPTAHHQPKVRRIIEDMFQKINNISPELPDDSRRTVHIELGKKIDDVLFKII